MINCYFIKRGAHFFPIFILLISALFGFFISYYVSKQGAEYLVLPILGLFSFVPISTLAIHIGYYRENRNVKLEIDVESGLFYWNKIQYRSDQIETIELHRNLKGIRRQGIRLPTDEFFYHKILLQNKEVLIFTSILIEDISCFRKKITEVQRLLPYIVK